MLNGTVRILLLILAFSVPAGLVELLICLFTKHRIFKYILPVLFFIGAIVLIISAKTVDTEGFRDIAYILLGLTSFFIFLLTGIMGLIFDVVKTKKKRKQQAEPSEEIK